MIVVKILLLICLRGPVLRRVVVYNVTIISICVPDYHISVIHVCAEADREPHLVGHGKNHFDPVFLTNQISNVVPVSLLIIHLELELKLRSIPGLYQLSIWTVARGLNVPVIQINVPLG